MCCVDRLNPQPNSDVGWIRLLGTDFTIEFGGASLDDSCVNEFLEGLVIPMAASRPPIPHSGVSEYVFGCHFEAVPNMRINISLRPVKVGLLEYSEKVA